MSPDFCPGIRRHQKSERSSANWRSVPRASVPDIAQLRLKSNTGIVLPLQVRPLDCWSDKSIRWALLDFFPAVEADSQAVFTLVNNEDQTGPKPEPANTISIVESEHTFIIDTGAAVFTLDRKGSKLFSSVSVDGLEILAGSGSETSFKDCGKRRLTARVDSLFAEETGVLRCAFKLEGKFVNVRNVSFCNFSARFTFFAGLSLAAIEFTIHNPNAALHPGGLWDLGDRGSLYFTDLSITFPSAGVFSKH